MYRWRGKEMPTAPVGRARARKAASPDIEERRRIKRIESQARLRAFNAWREADPEMYEREWRAALITVAATGGSQLTPSARHARARSVVVGTLSREHPDLWKPLYASKKAEVALEPKYAA